jgi:hypothetical protein
MRRDVTPEEAGSSPAGHPSTTTDHNTDRHRFHRPGSALSGTLEGRRNHMSGVIVLNASYEHLHVVSIQHAIRMLVREVAVVEEAHDGASIGPFPLPRVLRLVRYVVTKWRYASGRLQYTRAGVLRRDKHTWARPPWTTWCRDPVVDVASG